MTLLEIVIDSIASGAVATGATSLLYKFKRPKYRPDVWGAMPWLYKKSSAGTWGFYCPKCINIHKNTAQPPHCSCEAYHKDHYHFKCGDCGYETIMRTADDK